MKQSHRIISALVIAASSLGAVTAAQAQTSSGSNSGRGFSLYTPGASYIGFNAGQSDFSMGNGTNFFSSENKDMAYNIYGGSYFNPNFGFELGFTDFGKVSRGGGTTKAEGINLSLVGRAPISESFNLLGKLGTTYGRTDVSSTPGSGITSGGESGFGLSYGIGAEFVFSPNMSAVLQYDQHEMEFAGSDKERISATTVGLRYRF